METVGVHQKDASFWATKIDYIFFSKGRLYLLILIATDFSELIGRRRSLHIGVRTVFGTHIGQIYEKFAELQIIYIPMK